MNNNTEMIVYKEGLISKIKKFFRSLFGRHEVKTAFELNNSTEIKNQTDLIIERNNFFDTIKDDSENVDLVSKKYSFLKEIDGNREALSLLSLDRLKKLEQYYSEVINKNNNIINNLKTNNF